MRKADHRRNSQKRNRGCIAMSEKPKIVGLTVRNFMKRLRRKPKPKRHDQTWTTQTIHPQTEPTLNDLLSEGITPKQLETEMKQTLKEYAKLWTKKQQEKQKHDIEARKQWNIQKEPFYRFGLGAIYGMFGTTSTSKGYNRTGQDIASELRKLPKSELQGILKRMDDGEVPKPLTSYNKEYIERAKQWLVNTIRAKS